MAGGNVRVLRAGRTLAAVPLNPGGSGWITTAEVVAAVDVVLARALLPAEERERATEVRARIVGWLEQFADARDQPKGWSCCGTFLFDRAEDGYRLDLDWRTATPIVNPRAAEAASWVVTAVIRVRPAA